MLTSTTTSRQPKKYKSACDQCHTSKVKCPGGGPPCKRCADGFQICHYSLAARIGKPPGSKNRKTLERLRRVNGTTPEVNEGSGRGDNIFPQDNGNRNDDDRATHTIEMESQERRGLNAPLQPEISQHNFSDLMPSISPTSQNFLDIYHGMYLDSDDKTVLHPADLEFPGFDGLENMDSRLSWAEAPDDGWSASSPSINQQFSSSSIDTDSPPSAYSQSIPLEASTPISLDVVAARLEETAGIRIVRFEQSLDQQCQCLRKYTDVSSQLQNIENRQRPVRTDTLLTCTNIVLNNTAQQFRCTQCLYDSRVLMQLVMIFQTIFTWTQGQGHAPNDPCPDLRMTMGRHQMTREEFSFVRMALIFRTLDRVSAVLKAMMSRIDHITTNRRVKQSSGYEGMEFQNLQQFTSSLMHKFSALTKRLASSSRDQSGDGQ